MSTFSVILAAAGRSSRFNDPTYKKPFAILNQKAVWLHSAELFLKRNDVKQVIIVISPDDKEEFIAKFGPNIAVSGIDVAIGGNERADSVANALKKVDPTVDFVVIHDAARPCIHEEFIDTLFTAAEKHNSVIPALPVNSTLKRSSDGNLVDETVDRSNLYAAQTPQIFRRDLITELYENRGDFNPTDEAQLVESAGHTVAIIPGSQLNIKITSKADLKFAAACIKAFPVPRFDAPIHPFADGDLWR